jgi:dTDP-4-dehydrorhamnose reductase
MNKVLVVGSKGMLGSLMVEIFQEKGLDVTGVDINQLDITDENKAVKVVKSISPDVIINCAAYTNVNDAEDVGKEVNYKVNYLGVKNLITASNLVNSIFIHISTDYVFGNNDINGYTEEAIADSALNEYGKAKRLGEIEVENNNNKFFICRTAWLFGPNGKNFVHTMIELARTRDELSVVTDEIGTPTYTADLISQILYIIAHIKDLQSGYYHIVNSGKCSRFEEAEKAIRTAGLQTKLNETTLDKFPRKAKVPHYSVLVNTKLPHLRDWSEAVEEYVRENF